MIDSRLRNVALLIAGCFFMELLDGTIVVTAIPRISASLGVQAGTTGLVVTAYFVTVGVLIPLSSWMTLRFGYRQVLSAAIAIFTLASLGCAASQTLGQLVAARVAQGVGGAMMVPVGRMIVFERAEKTQLMRLMSYIVWPALIAPVIAPLAGGVITTYASWRWLFLINIPLGFAGFLLARRWVHGDGGQSPPRLDRLGVLLSCGGLSALTYGAHLISEQHPPWPLVVVLGLASAVLLLCATLHLLRAETPLLDLRTLSIPTFGNAMVGSSLIWLVIGAIPFLLPLLFQTAFGWSPIKSGAIVLFVFVGNVAIKPLTTPVYRAYGFRRVLLAASACLALTTIGCALLTPDTPVVAIALLAVISGGARSVSLTGYTTLALSDVPPAQMRTANALLSTGQQLFTGLAVAVATVALRLGEVLGRLLPGSPDARSNYTIAFLMMTVIGALATAAVLRLHPLAGEALTTESRVDATRAARPASRAS